MGTKDRDALKLTSMAPLDDGGRKYNIIYFIAVVVGILLGIFAGNGITSIVVATLMALIVALVIKNSILDFKWKGLRQQKFLLEKRVPYDFLIHHLITQLSSLNFQVEKGADGSPVLTRKKMIYDIEYGEDNTFTIYWRKSLVNAVFDFKTSIYHYRNTVADMGIIGYAVQTICCENAFGVGQQNLQNNTQSGFASDVQGNPPIYNESGLGNSLSPNFRSFFMFFFFAFLHIPENIFVIFSKKVLTYKPKCAARLVTIYASHQTRPL